MDQANDQPSRELTPEEAEQIIEAVMLHAANSTIGFMKLDLKGSQVADADPIGTGTLVHADEIYIHHMRELFGRATFGYTIDTDPGIVNDNIKR